MRVPRPLVLPLAAALVIGAAAGAGCGGKASRPMHPEEAWAFAISQILVRVEGRGPAEALVIVNDLIDKLDRGADFGALAASRSEHPPSAAQRGFMGFMNPHLETRFSGAIQSMRVGQTAGPVETQIGYQILYRHSFDEGRRLEEKYYIPVYGFTITSRGMPNGADRSPEEARARAQEAWQKVRNREVDLEDAARQYGDEPEVRPLAFLGMVNRSGEAAPIFDAVKDVKPGDLAPLAEREGVAFAVLVRGRYFRSVVRHILIEHARVPNARRGIQRSPEEALEMARAIIAQLDPEGANWAEMVTRHSDDVGTVPLAGGLGTFTSGELPPDMEAAVLEAKPGHVAPRPAVTERGVHVLWRVN